jgi:Ca2+-binding EF-hand superfamily protein
MKHTWILALAVLAAGCKKKSEQKPAAATPSRNVPDRDFRPGPLAGSDDDTERPDRVGPPMRRGGADRMGGGGPMSDRRAAFDTDGDGQLSDEEREAMRETRRAEKEERRAEMTAKFDKDGDGQLSEEERKPMKVERVQGMVTRLDADGDGKLSQAEFENGPRGRRRGPPIDFATADTDKDGSLSADELVAAMPERRRDGDGDEPPAPGDVQ